MKQVKNIKSGVSDKKLAEEYYKLFEEISADKGCCWRLHGLLQQWALCMGFGIPFTKWVLQVCDDRQVSAWYTKSTQATDHRKTTRRTWEEKGFWYREICWW